MAPSPVFPVLSRAIGEQLDQARESASDGGPDGIHDLRVSTRRLRAALDLWLDYAPGKKLDRCRETLRKLGRRLGAVRESDMNLEQLSELARARPSDSASIEFVAASEARRRRRRAKRLEKERERSDLSDLSAEIRSELAKALDSDAVSVSLAAVARRELDRRVPPLQELLNAALAQPSAPDLHRLRIELKKFRYSVELCAPAYDRRRLPRLVGRLKALQDALGAAQDSRVLHDRFAKTRMALRKNGLAAAERALLSPMRALAAMLRDRQADAVRRLETARREGVLGRFAPALLRTAEGVSSSPGGTGRSYTGPRASSARP